MASSSFVSWLRLANVPVAADPDRICTADVSLTEFAAGNKAVLIRGKGEGRKSYRLKLDDLLRKGNIAANVPVLPGDVILIPESVF